VKPPGNTIALDSEEIPAAHSITDAEEPGSTARKILTTL
jgi:hypothetical protein